MGRLMVITPPDLAPGFELAGVETFVVEDVDQAETILDQLLRGDEASLIVIRQGLLEAMSPRLQRRVSRSYRPVAIAVPGGIPTLASSGRRQRYLSELIRRAIGFRITFGPVQPAAEES
jgi:vacuolar-type H+-ATPase subunit F/Vma7